MNPSIARACYRFGLILGGFSVVPAYRVYRLDGAGKIAAADWVDADDDHDARKQARERMDGAHYEVWQRNRLVAREPQQPE